MVLTFEEFVKKKGDTHKNIYELYKFIELKNVVNMKKVRMEFDITNWTVRRRVKKLEEMGLITITKSRRFKLLTIKE